MFCVHPGLQSYLHPETDCPHLLMNQPGMNRFWVLLDIDQGMMRYQIFLPVKLKQVQK